MDAGIIEFRKLQHKKYLLSQIYLAFDKNSHDYSTIVEDYNEQIINKLDCEISDKRLVLIANSHFKLINDKPEAKIISQSKPEVEVELESENTNIITQLKTVTRPTYTCDYIDDDIYEDFLAIEEACNSEEIELTMAMALSLSIEQTTSVTPQNNANIEINEKTIDTVIECKPKQEIYHSTNIDFIAADKIISTESFNYILFDIDECGNGMNSFKYGGRLIVLNQDANDKIIKAVKNKSYMSLIDLMLSK
jgi:hypothetical protein